MTTLHDLMTRTPGLPCRLDPDAWYSDHPTTRHHAARRCAPCPLQAACRTYATDTRQEWGVWGGCDFTAVETYCGTERGHRMHLRSRERPCEWCLAAHAELVQGRRRERLEAEHAKGGTVRGYEIHRALGEPACAACMAASGRATKERRNRARRGRTRLTAVVVVPEARDPGPRPHAGVQPLQIAS